MGTLQMSRVKMIVPVHYALGVQVADDGQEGLQHQLYCTVLWQTPSISEERRETAQNESGGGGRSMT